MAKRLYLPITVVVFSQFGLCADSSSAPVLRWVKTVSGSGASLVAAVAADTRGNLYITGNTTSLDFPAVAAAQAQAGGSPLVRINPATGSTQKLYSPALATAGRIAADPENPLTLYAPSAAGLLRSTDGGNTWKALPGFPAATSLNSVAVDPTNSKILYAGTSPLGAFKSSDGGVTWTAINNGVPAISNQTVDAYGHLAIVKSLQIDQIWIDPKSPNVLFAASGKVLRSTDAGASWSVASLASDFVSSLVFDPFTKGTIYAAGLSLSRSADDGETWTSLASLPNQSQQVSIAADPFHKGTLYSGSFAGLFQSTDSGDTWALKIKAATTQIASDPNRPVIYANPDGLGIASSTDGFTTYNAIAQLQPVQLDVVGSFLFAVNPPTTDVFVTKLDPDGNIVYSTYFGGSGADSAAGIAVGNDGSVYVAGTTGSPDFPVTKGAYATTGANFVFKLNPDGSTAWSTYFADFQSFVQAIAVDAAGNPYIGGETSGHLPTTPGVYEEKFQSIIVCPGIVCLPPPPSAFLTKFNAQGTAHTFSTSISHGSKKDNLILAARSIALAPNGNVYFADFGVSFSPVGGVYLMDRTGTALLGSNTSQPVAINSIALDATGNLYATGFTSGNLVTTPGAFQSAPQPAIPSLPGSGTAGGGTDAYVLKFDSTLSKVLAATLLRGEGTDIAQSVAIDPSGNVIVAGYTDSKTFPARAPFQGSFSVRSGFVAGLDSSLSQLLFSTYLGDTRPFAVQGAIPDDAGHVLVAGSTQSSNGGYFFADPGFPYAVPTTVIANKIALHATPAVRLDSVVNYASQLGVPLSPGEAIAAIGSGFGSDAKLLFDGNPLPTVFANENRIVAVVPKDEKTSGAVMVSVSSNGVSSNPVYVLAAAASPGIYSEDNSGFGQGYILNADGSRNSQSNPAAPGSAITIFATGVGLFSKVGPYAVTDQPVAVFVNGFYASGIAAVIKRVSGLPGEVYEIGVHIPDPATLVSQNPDLLNFKMPPEVPVTMFVGPANSQAGIALWVM